MAQIVLLIPIMQSRHSTFDNWLVLGKILERWGFFTLTDHLEASYMIVYMSKLL